jgi:hypothetical protein
MLCCVCVSQPQMQQMQQLTHLSHILHYDLVRRRHPPCMTTHISTVIVLVAGCYGTQAMVWWNRGRTTPIRHVPQVLQQ